MSLPIVSSFKVKVTTLNLLEKYIRFLLNSHESEISVFIANPSEKLNLPEKLNYDGTKRFTIMAFQTNYSAESLWHAFINVQPSEVCRPNQAATSVDALIAVIKNTLQEKGISWAIAFRKEFQQPDIDGSVDVGYRIRMVGDSSDSFTVLIQLTYFEYPK